MLTNKCYLYAAFDCELQTTQSLDAAEDISIHLLPFQEVVEQIARGEIVHTIVATAFFTSGAVGQSFFDSLIKRRYNFQFP